MLDFLNFRHFWTFDFCKNVPQNSVFRNFNTDSSKVHSSRFKLICLNSRKSLCTDEYLQFQEWKILDWILDWKSVCKNWATHHFKIHLNQITIFFSTKKVYQNAEKILQEKNLVNSSLSLIKFSMRPLNWNLRVFNLASLTARKL